MDEKNDSDKSVDDFMLPGFRFHPTDEELVEFYLKMKLQHRPLPIDLIKQVDIYKYDPWDLPKLASTGEKEWYFYCPRDRKYRNSTRPNRVTGSGFWKATGTDRPIYSSGGAKCIGLKKSLVFYRGRAAKGIKTDWMMHEFRLPSAPHGGAPPHPQPRKIFDKSLPPTDSWAICRIFKKINSTANRPLCHNWASNSLPETNTNEFYNLSALNFGKTSTLTSANRDYFPGNLVFSEASADTSSKTTVDLASMFFNQGETTCKNSESLFEEAQHHYNGNYSVDSSQVIQAGVNGGDDREGLGKNTSVNHHVWENIRSIGFPFSLPATGQDSWKANLPWDSPDEISSTTYSTNKSYI